MEAHSCEIALRRAFASTLTLPRSLSCLYNLMIARYACIQAPYRILYRCDPVRSEPLSRNETFGLLPSLHPTCLDLAPSCGHGLSSARTRLGHHLTLPRSNANCSVESPNPSQSSLHTSLPPYLTPPPRPFKNPSSTTMERPYPPSLRSRYHLP